MTPDFRISKGNLPTVQDTLQDDGGPVNLAGCTVKFNFQLLPAEEGISFSNPATITTPATGQVSYAFAAGETAAPGLYQAQWEVTDGVGVKRTFPTGSLNNDDDNGRYIQFEIVDVVPLNPEAGIMELEDTYEGIRAMLGDHNPQFRKYEDGVLASVVRTCLRSGKLPGYCLSPNRMGIVPPITVPRDFGLLIHHAAKMILLPDAGDYSYKTRALSERFGEQRLFVQNLENALYDLQNGEVFSTFQSFYGWVNALTGMNIWSLMTDMTTRAPVANVIIGRAGIQVNTT